MFALFVLRTLCMVLAGPSSSSVVLPPREKITGATVVVVVLYTRQYGTELRLCKEINVWKTREEQKNG